MSNNTNIKLKIAHDGGNGFMKDQINKDRFIFPSVISPVLPGSEPSVTEVEDTDKVQKIMNDFLDHMDITVQSKGININGRYQIGRSASHSISPMTFNVNSNEGKADSDISIICLLSLASYYALNKYFKENSDIPSNLIVDIEKFITALPIDEIKLKGAKERFIERFTSNNHIVIINNFSKPVSITLSFKKGEVQPEGIIAENGLIAEPENSELSRNDGIFDELNKDYDLDIKGQDLLKMGNVLGIDIGEGTVDFSVTNSAAPVPTLNSSILLGIGNATENAINALHQDYPVIGKINRQAFIEIANRDNSKESQTYKHYLDSQLIILEQQITEQVKSIYRTLNSQVGLIFICGGGASVLKNHFEKRFSKIIDEVSPFDSAPIMWVDEKFAQNLNLDGLVFRLNWMK